MKLLTLSSTISLLSILALPVTALAGSDFDSAVKEANAEIAKAKAANYEWRDSKKILDKAVDAEKKGDHDKAMKLVAKAKQQGTLAVLQSKAQKDAAMKN